MTDNPTNNDIYLRLGELAGTVRAVHEKLDGHHVRMDGHGVRLNLIEKEQVRVGVQRNMMAALMGSVAAGVVTVVAAVVRGTLGRS